MKHLGIDDIKDTTQGIIYINELEFNQIIDESITDDSFIFSSIFMMNM